MNVNILGISKQNEMEWVNLTQMTIISTIVGKNPLGKNGVTLELTKEAEMQHLGAISKMTE